MKIEDLDNDMPFLEGLRNGEFCLVLGAGFSFGLEKDQRLKNKTRHSNPLYQNIPLTEEFIEITKLEFNISESQFSEAVSHWEKAIVTDLTKRELFRNLFLLDVEDFNRRYYSIYEAILIPNWYRVFTFNFDDVFENICQNEEYIPISFPEKKEFDSIEKKQIAHIHGRITDKSNLGSLVFFGENYALLHSDTNSFYNALLNSVNSVQNEKKLIILGCKFNEHIHIQKFFLQLDKSKKSEIYHFAPTQPSISGNIDHINYRFITANTCDFLQFLQRNRTKIERIAIDGAMVITRDFFDTIRQNGKERNFKPSDFYLAKHNHDDLQWYGIEENWDIRRKDFERVKDEVILSFNDKFREEKITAVIYGRGGSGKSTMLRRLAANLSNRNFAVLWVSNISISMFYQSGLKKLVTDYSHKMFLILVDDWYQVKKSSKEAKTFIDGICSHKNVRVVVGDRTIDNQIREHIYDVDRNIFKLTSEENKATIEQIVEINKEWKETAKLLLRLDPGYKSSLYYILWVIGRTFERLKKGGTNSIIQSDNLKGHFQSLIISDLNAIEKLHPGVAKMLYYWANVYTEEHIFISFDLFFMLTEIFCDNNNNASKYPQVSDELRSILDIYIYRGEGNYKIISELGLLAFNHDILADDGLSKVKLNGWHSFDDSIILQMLSVVVDKADDFSASGFLWYALLKLKPESLNTNSKVEFINKLFVKGNYGSYLSHIFYKQHDFPIQFTNDWASKLIQLFLSGEQMPHSLISNCLSNLKETVGRGKVQAEELIQRYISGQEISFAIISKCLSNLKETEDKGKSLAEELIQRYIGGQEISFPIISNCLSNLKETKHKGESQAEELIWLYIEGKEIAHAIISNCLSNLKETEGKGKSQADKLIQLFIEGKEMAYAIICNCLSNLKETEEKGRSQAEELIQLYIGGREMFHAIISNCLSNLKETEHKGKSQAEELILLYIEGKEMAHAIISNCLSNLKETEHKGKSQAEELILLYIEGKEMAHAIISNCLSNLKETEEKGKSLAEELIQLYIGGREIFHAIISNCFFNLKETEEKGRSQAEELIQLYIGGRDISHAIINNCLSNLKETEDKGKFLVEELIHLYINGKKMSNSIINNCLSNLKETEEMGISYATYFLQNYNWKDTKNWSTIYHSLNCYSNMEKPSELVMDIVNSIINEVFDKTNDRSKYFRFRNIMKIPFHSIPLWKSVSKSNIANWHAKGRDLVTNTILAYRSHPSEIKVMCSDILKNYQRELSKKITQNYGEPHRGDHVLLSLMHPDLKPLSKETAQKLAEEGSAISKIIPDCLQELIDQIINEGKFPSWNNESEINQAYVDES